MTRKYFGILGLIAVATFGCSEDECGPSILLPAEAFELVVLDSITGLSVMDSAQAVLSRPGFTEQFQPGTTQGDRVLSLVAGGYGYGVYDVTVTRPGYKVWRETGLELKRGRCNAVNITVALTARLQKG